VVIGNVEVETLLGRLNGHRNFVFPVKSIARRNTVVDCKADCCSQVGPEGSATAELPLGDGGGVVIVRGIFLKIASGYERRALQKCQTTDVRKIF